jgi:His-Xaa-Ser system protein HxsD
MEKTENMEFNESEGTVLISLNPRIYTIQTVMATSYVFLGNTYVLIDGEPEEELIIELKPKHGNPDKKVLEKLARDFMNELVQFTVYENQSKKNAEVKSILFRKAFLSANKKEGSKK